MVSCMACAEGCGVNGWCLICDTTGLDAPIAIDAMVAHSLIDGRSWS
jgi:hypothetical protein